jgi:Actin
MSATITDQQAQQMMASSGGGGSSHQQQQSLLLSQPVVIDNGSATIKAGFAGSSKPKVHYCVCVCARACVFPLLYWMMDNTADTKILTLLVVCTYGWT